MFFLVVVLATVVWQSLSGKDDLIKQELVSQEFSNQELVEKDTKQQDNEKKTKTTKSSKHKQQTESTLNNMMNSYEAEIEASEEQNVDQKLCELVETYDDWQKTSTGYTSQKLIDEVRGWGDTRGYFEMEYNGSRMEIKKTSDYDYYETEDLKQMADAGDTIANVKMAYRLFLEGDEASLEKAQPYCERAIVDGYSSMHGCVITYLNNLLTHHENQEEPNIERIKELQIESQAWKEMYQLRNDPLGDLIYDNSTSIIEEVEVTDAEVKQRTQALYQDLVRKRSNLGLGPFKNTEAPEIIKYAVANNINEGAVASCFE